MSGDQLPRWREAPAAAAEQNWAVIDMAADWSTVYPLAR
jgi:hypothetical protein